jgi:hypothetical protein
MPTFMYEAAEFLATCVDDGRIEQPDGTMSLPTRERWLIPIEARFLSPTEDIDIPVVIGDRAPEDPEADPWNQPYDMPRDPWAAAVAIDSITRLADGRVSISTAWESFNLKPDDLIWLIIHRPLTKEAVHRIRWLYPDGPGSDPAIRPEK